jgi:predicted AAA+ superfamily ATPase
MAKLIIRDFVDTIEKRVQEKRPLIQVILGPRQVGKTTGIKQFLVKIKSPYVYASADDVISPGRIWLLEKWQAALLEGKGVILVVDEIQKIPNWPEVIKKLWDKEERGQVKLILLGSSSDRSPHLLNKFAEKTAN